MSAQRDYLDRDIQWLPQAGMPNLPAVRWHSTRAEMDQPDPDTAPPPEPAAGDTAAPMVRWQSARSGRRSGWFVFR